jgi:hypothetical protein
MCPQRSGSTRVCIASTALTTTQIMNKLGIAAVSFGAVTAAMLAEVVDARSAARRNTRIAPRRGNRRAPGR